MEPFYVEILQLGLLIMILWYVLDTRRALLKIIKQLKKMTLDIGVIEHMMIAKRIREERDEDDS